MGEETARDPNLTVFLERFSQDTQCYQMEPRAFVAELSRRWRERNPHGPAPVDAPFQPSLAHAVHASSTPTIFLSYAREDIDAARQLYKELQAIGGDVAWFDKTEIRPGDDWR